MHYSCTVIGLSFGFNINSLAAINLTCCSECVGVAEILKQVYSELHTCAAVARHIFFLTSYKLIFVCNSCDAF